MFELETVDWFIVVHPRSKRRHWLHKEGARTLCGSEAAGMRQLFVREYDPRNDCQTCLRVFRAIERRGLKLN